MKPMISIPFVLAMTGCLYSGEGTLGLPCNTDTECGGTQLCIEHVCGGPAEAGSDSSGIGASSDGSGEDTVASNAEQSGDDDEVRTECLASETECVDSSALRECVDGKLETFACEAHCYEGTEHNGCHTNPGGVDECWCLNPATPCETEGAVKCDGPNILECNGGFNQPFDCDTICLDAGYGGVDYCGSNDNGEPTCFCFDSGCTEGASRCIDEDTAQDCWNGEWQTSYNCDTVCPEGTYARGCTYFAGETTGCGCWEY